MHPTDQRILRLIELLIFQKKIHYANDFCQDIGMLQQTITKIKKGKAHFTVSQIELICHKYNVNANWIFGLEKNVYNGTGNIEI
ncbi:hypothetical protein EV143_1321 [Flavobacterium chryseum]|uniref:helix-turn-helix domain-containing protein n=1 Tax=Flavobacterium sp. P3160 TaxID=2512113 RepID=UPI0010E1CE84|nr:helix-turn-helix transcriptional regulator [Flavobacterium sp. P3160]TDO67090.1 hypothetical protein EV143_1321 [Flavobacterium sp. P3160]